MKIAVWHNLPSGGGKRALYCHVKALKEAGHYLEAWSTDMASPDYLPLSDLIIEHRLEIKENYLALWKIKNPITREQKVLELLENHFKQCIRAIENGKFDLIFANSCSITYMPFIGLYTDMPCIAYVGEPNRALYESFPDNIWKAPYPVLRLKKIKRLINDYRLNYSRRLRVLKEIEAANSYRKILVNSLFSRENFIKAYGIDANVCYLGIDTEFFKADSLKKESYIVGLGTISFIKGTDKVVEIVGKIPVNIRPALKWIYNGYDEAYLREMQNLADGNNVNLELYHNITDNELAEIVSGATVMIYCPRLEPFGLAPLEANACGTYVIALAEGGVRESITNGINGTLIKGFHIDEFVEEIVTFINDPEYSAAKGMEARKFVMKYWDQKVLASNIISEIESAL